MPISITFRPLFW
jgi:hypothetical protein